MLTCVPVSQHTEQLLSRYALLRSAPGDSIPGSHSLCSACHLWRGPSTPRETLCSIPSKPGSAPIINMRISHSPVLQEDSSRAGPLFHFPSRECPGQGGSGSWGFKARDKTFLSEPTLVQGSVSIWAGEEKVGGGKPGSACSAGEQLSLRGHTTPVHVCPLRGGCQSW